MLVAGCAGQSGGQVAAGAGLSTAPTTTTGGRVPGPAMPGLHLPPGSTPVAGNRVDASALPATFPREVWTQGDGTLVGFDGEEGGCFTSGASVTAQTDSQVTIRLVQHEQPIGHMCPMNLAYRPMSVTLDRPLGARTVVLQLTIQRG